MAPGSSVAPSAAAARSCRVGSALPASLLGTLAWGRDGVEAVRGAWAQPASGAPALPACPVPSRPSPALFPEPFVFCTSPIEAELEPGHAFLCPGQGLCGPAPQGARLPPRTPAQKGPFVPGPACSCQAALARSGPSWAGSTGSQGKPSQSTSVGCAGLTSSGSINPQAASMLLTQGPPPPPPPGSWGLLDIGPAWA